MLAAPSRRVRRLQTGVGLLLLDTTTNSLRAYNESARILWDLLQQDGDEESLTRHFAEGYGIPQATARADIEPCWHIGACTG